MIETPGRFHSKATDHVVAGANEILDDDLNKKQSVINAENESFKDAQTELNEAQSEFNSEVREALGTGGNVDERIANAVNTEKDRAEGAEEALDGRVETLEDAVGTGGSVDSRISAAVATETTRAQAAEADRYTKSETYTKEEVHNLITTPSQEYVSVTATDQTTAVTDVLPATGAADTTYRVGNWDGTQYNDSVFSEYAWNGSAYIKLSTKSQIGEVYDISANHADTKYADLAAALGTNGANVPQSLRKGGMSVKFVQSSDNKYVRYNLLDDSFTTDTTQWAIDDAGVYVDNPEYIQVTTDNEDKILEGIKTDGTKVIGGDVQIGGNTTISEDATILGKVDIQGATYTIQENSEWIKVLTDAQDRIIAGVRKDGSVYIGELEGLDDKLQGILSIIEQSMDLKGKKVSIIGDSISTYEGYSTEGYEPSYPYGDVQSVNDTWWMQVINYWGASLNVNTAISGSTSSSAKIGFSPRVPLLNNPDIVFVELGANDSGRYIEIGDVVYGDPNPDLSKFGPSYEKGIRDIMTLYPNATIVCVIVYVRDEYADVIKEIANHYNIAAIDVRGKTIWGHPDKAGMKGMADYICENTISIAISGINSKIQNLFTKTTWFENTVFEIDNPEFIGAEVDENNILISATLPDGTKIFKGDVQTDRNLCVNGFIDNKFKSQSIVYDSKGNVSSVATKSKLGEVIIENIVRNENGRVNSIVERKNNTVLSTTILSYDENNRVINIEII